MLRYLASRLLVAALMVLLATLAIFLIANMVPGDPVLTQLGDIAANNPEMVAAFRHRWGLDLPLWERYWLFLTGLFHGDLGISIASQRPVLEDIAQYGPATVELSTIAFLLSLAIGLPLGVLAAVRRDSWIDHLARSVSLIGVSAPTFWLAFIMLAVFYGALEWAPGPGQISASAFPPPEVTGIMLIDAPLAGDWDTFHDALGHLVLPSIVLAAGTMGLITRTTRAAMLEALSQDYIRVARAKGLTRRGHHLRPRAAERAAAGGDPGRPGLRATAHRHGADRDDLLLAWPWPLHVPQRGHAWTFRRSWGSRRWSRRSTWSSTCWWICPTPRSIRAWPASERDRPAEPARRRPATLAAPLRPGRPGRRGHPDLAASRRCWRLMSRRIRRPRRCHQPPEAAIGGVSGWAPMRWAATCSPACCLARAPR